MKIHEESCWANFSTFLVPRSPQSVEMQRLTGNEMEVLDLQNYTPCHVQLGRRITTSLKEREKRSRIFTSEFECQPNDYRLKIIQVVAIERQNKFLASHTTTITRTRKSNIEIVFLMYVLLQLRPT